MGGLASTTATTTSPEVGSIFSNMHFAIGTAAAASRPEGSSKSAEGRLAMEERAARPACGASGWRSCRRHGVRHPRRRGAAGGSGGDGGQPQQRGRRGQWCQPLNASGEILIHRPGTACTGDATIGNGGSGRGSATGGAGADASADDLVTGFTTGQEFFTQGAYGGNGGTCRWRDTGVAGGIPGTYSGCPLGPHNREHYQQCHGRHRRRDSGQHRRHRPRRAIAGTAITSSGNLNVNSQANWDYLDVGDFAHNAGGAITAGTGTGGTGGTGTSVLPIWPPTSGTGAARPSRETSDAGGRCGRRASPPPPQAMAELEGKAPCQRKHHQPIMRISCRCRSYPAVTGWYRIRSRICRAFAGGRLRHWE